jgi:trk system potassium uptake protein TrkA
MDGSVEALEFLVQEEIEGLTDLPLRELAMVDNVLIACIMRDGATSIPTGNDTIRRGDTVVVVTKSGTQMDSIGDILK